MCPSENQAGQRQDDLLTLADDDGLDVADDFFCRGVDVGHGGFSNLCKKSAIVAANCSGQLDSRQRANSAISVTLPTNSGVRW